MARSPRWTQQQWEEHGANAIADLVNERRVVTWAEVEARISVAGWKEFRKVQPVQLTGALRRLRGESPRRIEEDWTQHDSPIHTLRSPYPPGGKREMDRLRGHKRKLYLRYIHWTQNETLCGKQAEYVVHDSLLAASSRTGLYVPEQVPGNVTEVAGVQLQRGPLDLWAWMLDLDTISSELPMAVEVKNVRRWLYASARELWELLVKAAEIALQTPVLPVLACCWSGPTAWWMAYDIGFFTAQMRNQIFSLAIDETQFVEVAEEFGLPIIRHDGPLDSLVTWLGTDVRKSPPSPPPEDVAWYRRQAERFQVIAPIVLDFEVLARGLAPGEREPILSAFRARVRDAATWPLRGGW